MAARPAEFAAPTTYTVSPFVELPDIEVMAVYSSMHLDDSDQQPIGEERRAAHREPAMALC